MTSWRSRMSCDVSHWLTSWKDFLYDVSHWLTSWKKVLCDVSHWLTSWKKFFVTSAIGWRHKTPMAAWWYIHVNSSKKAQSPCSNATFYFAVDFLHVLGPNVYKRRHWYSCRENVGMKQRMHRFETAFIFLLQFPWRNKLQSCSSRGKQDERDVLYGCTYSRESLTVGLVCTSILARVESCSTAFFVLG
jgi:hypothetical protein